MTTFTELRVTQRLFCLCRYVPTDWALKTELTLDEVSELNTMNIELAGLLGKKNPAFTPFQHGNFSCIMIKEVSIVNVTLCYVHPASFTHTHHVHVHACTAASRRQCARVCS